MIYFGSDTLKTTTSVRIEKEALDLAKTNNINMSRILQNAIYNQIGTTNIEGIERELNYLVEKREKALKDAKDLGEQIENLEMQLKNAQNSRVNVHLNANEILEQHGTYFKKLQSSMSKYYACYMNKASGSEKWLKLKRLCIDKYGLNEDELIKFANGYFTVEQLANKLAGSGLVEESGEVC